MVSRKFKRLAIVGGVIGILLFAGTVTGILPAFFQNLLRPVGVYHAGVVVFYNEPRADDDTTDIDGAGTLEVIDALSLAKKESTLTLGTDSERSFQLLSFSPLWRLCTRPPWR
jgi:hypothetical protein